MKTTRAAKAFVSVALVITLLMSMCVAGFTGVSAAGLSLAYDFAYDNAGYAEGILTLSGASGNYQLYWADDTKALEGYAPIAITSVGTGARYLEMPENTAIPAGATKVIAVSGGSATVANAAAVFDIPADKQFKGGTKEYSFEALSDLHVQHDDSYWYLSKTHFANALEVAVEREVDFMTICGDMVNGYAYSNLEKEFPQYLQLIAKSNYNNPIYETNGNHEMKGGSASQNLELYKKYTGLNTTTGTLQSAPYYEKTINGDHYIFMVLEISGSPNESSEFTTAQLDWFEGLLKKYYGDGNKIIVNQHCLIRGYGAGDNKLTPYYGGALNQSYADVQRLMSIMEKYPDIIMMGGHSHIDFKYGYNFDNENGNTCYTVHIPSTSSTTHPNSSGSTDYTMDKNSSQGYLVDVYDDYVVLNGTDLAFNNIYPAYTYLVDYTGEELVKNDLPEIVYDTVTVTVDVSAVTDAPAAVNCIAYTQNNTASKQYPMTKNADGTYTAKLSTEYAKMKFMVDCGAGNYTSGEYAIANCKVVLGGLKVQVKLSDITTKTGGSCTGWTTVNTYAWNKASNANCGAWPGTVMTKMSDGTYVALLAEGVNPDMIIFSSGSDQTADLSITPYVVEEIKGSYTVDGEEVTTPTEAPKPTTTDATEAKPTEASTTATDATEATDPTEASTAATDATEATDSTEPTEPAVDELAPILIIEETNDGYFLAAAYAADGAEDVQYQFAVNGSVVKEYSEISTLVFGVNTSQDGYCYVEVTAKYADGSLHVTRLAFEVKDGVAILPEMPERPTEPVSTPDEVTTAPTESSTATETTVPEVEYLYGDADMDGKVNIKDATTIQKYAAKLTQLEGTAFTQADVTGDTKVNVKDATAIQKFVAKLMDKFPVEEGVAELASVGAAIDDLRATVKTVLSTEYQYASYDAYLALKKAYMTNADYTALNNAYTDYKTMKGNNPISNPGGTANIGDINIGQTGTGTPDYSSFSIGGATGGSSGDTTGGNTGGDNTGGSTGGNTGGSTTTETIKIYLKPDSSWAGAYIYGFYGVVGGTATSEPLGTYPGTAMKADSDGWYVADVPADIDYIKFCDGSSTNHRTDNISNSLFEDGTTFTITTLGSKYWSYTTGSTVTPPDDDNTNTNVPSGTASDFVIHGNLSGSWADTVLYISSTDSNIATATVDVAAGSYAFVMHNTSTDEWIKNPGTIDDTCDGWRFGTDKDGDTTFNATGGTYVFSFDLATLKLSITKK